MTQIIMVAGCKEKLEVQQNFIVIAQFECCREKGHTGPHMHRGGGPLGLPGGQWMTQDAMSAHVGWKGTGL